MSSHSKAAKRFVADAERMAWHDRALYAVREKRDRMAQSVPEWEALREAASAIKRHTLSRLGYYLELFERNATANGIEVHWAADAAEMNATVWRLVEEHGGRNLIKSKSMLSEECGLTPYLRERGVDAVESDLGERIMQLLKLPPSHIVLPAIGVRREEVGELFAREMGTEPGNSDPTYLTHAARRNLRARFLGADISMTGVNFAVAETGALAVCTNEGNADLGTSFCDLHIAIMGLEKVIPDMRALGVFTRLLARSGTGQPVTTYTSLYRRPAPGKRIHVIIVDNGRTEWLADEAHRNMLKCLRCGACMNTCPVYRRSGGYSYSYFIPGPLGINLSMLRSPALHHGNVSACTLCYSCSNVCPAKIDLGEQIYLWRQQLDRDRLADPAKKAAVKAMDVIMRSPRCFYGGIALARVAEHLPAWMLDNGMNPWCAPGRAMPRFAPHTFNALWKRGEIEKTTDHE
nr:LUD domain-containing protein [uncultured Alistipes sp.]